MTIKIINGVSGDPVPYASVTGYKSSGEYSGLGNSANDLGNVDFDLHSWQLNGVSEVHISSAGFIPESKSLSGLADGQTIQILPNEGDLSNVIVTGIRKHWVGIVIVLAILTVVGIIYASSKKK